MQVASFAPITSSPRGTRSSSLILSCARRRRSRICSAYSAKILPAGVSAIGSEPFKQRCVQFLFELPHLSADRRLRAIAGLSGFGEAFQSDDLEKCMELVEIHIWASIVSG